MEDLTPRKGHVPKDTLGAIGRAGTGIQTSVPIITRWDMAQPQSLQTPHGFLSVPSGLGFEWVNE